MKNDKMKENHPAADSRLHLFFADALKDIYWAEQELTKRLPEMAEAATSGELQDAFLTHRDETEQHAERLTKVFEWIGEPVQSKRCEAIAGLVKEAETIKKETEAGTATRDVGLIMAAQKIEHYEMATYGGLATLAKTLGYDAKVVNLLKDTLAEEKLADELLSGIAEGQSNVEAAAEQHQ